MTLDGEITLSDGNKSNHNSISDRELIEEILAGNSAHFEELFKRYERLVTSVVNQRVRRDSNLEDHIQEIFTKAYLGLPTFRFESSFSSWLCKIAIYHVYSFLDSRRFRNQKVTDLEPNSAWQLDHTFDSKMDRKFTFDKCIRLVKGLPLEYRNIVWLCGLRELSYEEAAQVLSIPVGTVRSRLHKARQLLLAQMQ